MKSWKKQLLWGLGGTMVATLLFGSVLSFIVNQGLKQLEQQPPDVLFPQTSEPTSEPIPTP